MCTVQMCIDVVRFLAHFERFGLVLDTRGFRMKGMVVKETPDMPHRFGVFRPVLTAKDKVRTMPTFSSSRFFTAPPNQRPIFIAPIACLFSCLVFDCLAAPDKFALQTALPPLDRP